MGKYLIIFIIFLCIIFNADMKSPILSFLIKIKSLILIDDIKDIIKGILVEVVSPFFKKRGKEENKKKASSYILKKEIINDRGEKILVLRNKNLDIKKLSIIIIEC